MSQGLVSKSLAALIILSGVAALVWGVVWLDKRDQAGPPEAPAAADPAPSGASGTKLKHAFTPFPKAAFVGDTYAASMGSGNGRSWVDDVTANMCWSVSGKSIEMRTGYTNPGPSQGTSVFTERIDDVSATGPSIVVIEGGLHDYEATPDQLYEAAKNVFASGRGLLPPETMIVVVGPPKPPSVTPEDAAKVLDPIARAAADTGLPFINPVAENWLPDNSFFLGDGLLLDAKGHQEFARRLSEHLRQLGAPAGC